MRKQITETEDSPNQIEVNLNASGRYSWTIKLNFDLDEEETITRIERIDSRLRKKFPNPGSNAK